MNTEIINPQDKQKILGILKVLFPEAKIYLFGSRATGNPRPHSDVDIALEAEQPIRRLRIAEALAMFKESNLTYDVDIVDLNDVSPEFKKSVLKDAIIWKE